MKTESLTLLAESEFNHRSHIPLAVDQMLLGNAENKSSLSFPSASWESSNGAEKKGMDP